MRVSDADVIFRFCRVREKSFESVLEDEAELNLFKLNVHRPAETVTSSGVFSVCRARSAKLDKSLMQI